MAPIQKMKTYSNSNKSLVNNSVDAFNVLFATNMTKRLLGEKKKKRYLIKELPRRKKGESVLVDDSLQISTEDTFDKLIKNNGKGTEKFPAINISDESKSTTDESKSTTEYGAFNHFVRMTRQRKKNLLTSNSSNSANLETTDSYFLKRFQQPTNDTDKIEDSLEVEKIVNKPSLPSPSFSYIKAPDFTTISHETPTIELSTDNIARNFKQNLMTHCSTPIASIKQVQLINHNLSPIDVNSLLKQSFKQIDKWNNEFPSSPERNISHASKKNLTCFRSFLKDLTNDPQCSLFKNLTADFSNISHLRSFKTPDIQQKYITLRQRNNFKTYVNGKLKSHRKKKNLTVNLESFTNLDKQNISRQKNCKLKELFLSQLPLVNYVTKKEIGTRTYKNSKLDPRISKELSVKIKKLTMNFQKSLTSSESSFENSHLKNINSQLSHLKDSKHDNINQKKRTISLSDCSSFYEDFKKFHSSHIKKVSIVEHSKSSKNILANSSFNKKLTLTGVQSKEHNVEDFYANNLNSTSKDHSAGDSKKVIETAKCKDFKHNVTIDRVNVLSKEDVLEILCDNNLSITKNTCYSPTHEKNVDLSNSLKEKNFEQLFRNSISLTELSVNENKNQFKSIKWKELKVKIEKLSNLKAQQVTSRSNSNLGESNDYPDGMKSQDSSFNNSSLNKILKVNLTNLNYSHVSNTHSLNFNEENIKSASDSVNTIETYYSGSKLKKNHLLGNLSQTEQFEIVPNENESDRDIVENSLSDISPQKYQQVLKTRINVLKKKSENLSTSEIILGTKNVISTINVTKTKPIITELKQIDTHFQTAVGIDENKHVINESVENNAFIKIASPNNLISSNKVNSVLTNEVNENVHVTAETIYISDEEEKIFTPTFFKRYTRSHANKMNTNSNAMFNLISINKTKGCCRSIDSKSNIPNIKVDKNKQTNADDIIKNTKLEKSEKVMLKNTRAMTSKKNLSFKTSRPTTRSLKILKQNDPLLSPQKKMVASCSKNKSAKKKSTSKVNVSRVPEKLNLNNDSVNVSSDLESKPACELGIQYSSVMDEEATKSKVNQLKSDFVVSLEKILLKPAVEVSSNSKILDCSHLYEEKDCLKMPTRRKSSKEISPNAEKSRRTSPSMYQRNCEFLGSEDLKSKPVCELEFQNLDKDKDCFKTATCINTPKNITLKGGKSWRRSLSMYRRNSEFLGFPKVGYKNPHSEKNPVDQVSRLHSQKCPKRLSVRFVTTRPLSISRTDTTILEDYASYVPDQILEANLEDSFRCLSVNQNQRSSLKNQQLGIPITARDLVLRKCGQTELLQFSKCFPDNVFQNCQKIGEGVYGEVFLFRNLNGGTSVLKIVPVEGDLIVNGERQKKFEEVLSEIIITIELSNLRNNKRNGISAFTEVQKIQCVQGRYPEKLLELWDLFDETRGSENDCPEVFGEEQIFIVFQMAYGGRDLESFIFNNAMQAYSIIQQVSLALAIAEEELHFEHRDLHWGNVLVSAVEANKVTSFIFENKTYELPTMGVEVAIIDYTLSRIEHDGVVIFNDLGQDPDLFTAEGDYQFEIYKLMQQKNRNNWKEFEPFSNLLWLHYILDKALVAFRYKNVKTRRHKEYLRKLKMLKEDILSYHNIKDFVAANLLDI